MQRYFVNKKDGDSFIMNEEQTRHILKVMRMRVHDEIEVCYEETVYLCMITSVSPLKVMISRKKEENHELPNKITLFYCLPKGEKLDLVIQKATELGVSEIILVQSKFCVCKYKKDDFAKKLERFNKIVVEAAEQSKRNVLPKLDKIIDYKDIKNYDFDHKFIAYEKEDDRTFYSQLRSIKKDESIAILVGAEGGFDVDEVEYAKENGYTSVSLGQRILRSETAVFYALSVIGFMNERNVK